MTCRMGRRGRRRFYNDVHVMEQTHESETEIDVEHNNSDVEEITEAKKLKMATSLDRDVDICANGDADIFGVRHDIRDTLNLMTARDSPLNHMVGVGADDVTTNRPSSVCDDLTFNLGHGFGKQLEHFNLSSSSSLMDTGLDIHDNFSVPMMDMPLFNEIEEVNMMNKEHASESCEDESLSMAASLSPVATTTVASAEDSPPYSALSSLTPVSPVSLSQSPVSLPMSSCQSQPTSVAELPLLPDAVAQSQSANVPETAGNADPKTGALIVPLQDAKGQLLGNIVLRQDLKLQKPPAEDVPKQIELNDAYIIWNGANAPGLLTGQGLRIVPDTTTSSSDSPGVTSSSSVTSSVVYSPPSMLTPASTQPMTNTRSEPLAAPLTQRSMSLPLDLERRKQTAATDLNGTDDRDVTAARPAQRETILQIEKRRSRAARKASSADGSDSVLSLRQSALDGASAPLSPDQVSTISTMSPTTAAGPPYANKPNVGDVDRFIICSDTTMECVLCSFTTDSYSAFKSHIICSHPCWRITKKLSKNRLLVEKSAKAVASLENSKKHIDSLNLHMAQRKKQLHAPERRKEGGGDDLAGANGGGGGRRKNAAAAKTRHKSKSKRVFKCDVCSRLFVFEGSAANHVTEVHGKTEAHRAILVSNDYGQTFGPLYRCSFRPCVFTAFTKGDLDDHVTALHSQAVYRCQWCGFSADSEASLKMHSERIHGQFASVMDV